MTFNDEVLCLKKLDLRRTTFWPPSGKPPRVAGSWRRRRWTWLCHGTMTLCHSNAFPGFSFHQCLHVRKTGPRDGHSALTVHCCGRPAKCQRPNTFPMSNCWLWLAQLRAVHKSHYPSCVLSSTSTAFCSTRSQESLMNCLWMRRDWRLRHVPHSNPGILGKTRDPVNCSQFRNMGGWMSKMITKLAKWQGQFKVRSLKYKGVVTANPLRYVTQTNIWQYASVSR